MGRSEDTTLLGVGIGLDFIAWDTVYGGFLLGKCVTGYDQCSRFYQVAYFIICIIQSAHSIPLPFREFSCFTALADLSFGIVKKRINPYGKMEVLAHGG